MIDRYNAFLYRDANATGGDGPLAGKTVGVKANIMVRDMPFHGGIGALEDRIADRDAATVAALRAAGAAIVGITNMEEAALGSKTDNPHFGATQNPHRDGYSPGGSSGGSAAAVAAGLCDIALGTDTMGSIRIPAAHCGIYGFKPATEAVSQDGLEPAELSLDAIGPFARDLDTLERASFAMCDLGTEIKDLPGATLVEHGVDIHPNVAATFAQTMNALPHPVAKTKLGFPNSRIRFAGFIKVAKAMAAHLHGVPTSDHLARLMAYGPKREHDDWTEDQTVLARTAEQVRAIVSEHGWLILPTVPNPPFPHNETEPAAQADFTCLANIAGLPAMSIPAGWTDDGLPIGVQIIARTGGEAGMFALARRLNAKLRAYRAPQ